MTRIDDALNALYGKNVRNLTADGYRGRLNKLRKINPSLAKQITRQLEPFLAEDIFSRRKTKWYQTSEGTRVRLLLLNQNPHLKQDVSVIRSILGIPNSHVKATENSPEWREISSMVKQKSVRIVLEGNMAGTWHNIHCSSASGESIDLVNEGYFSSRFAESAIASARINFKEKGIPEWLQKPPSGPAPYNNKAAPVDWVAGRLVERYQLPWHAVLSIVFYIITENSSFLENIEPLEVQLGHSSNPHNDVEAFSVLVKGMDEFVGKKEWDSIWKRVIKPRQLNIWERRGTMPQGRRATDISRLEAALPKYRKIVEGRKTFPQAIADPDWGDLDQETIRRVLSDLSKLLKPVL